MGIWRGGGPIAIAVHEALNTCGHACDHTVVRAQSYRAIAKQNGTVSLLGFEYLKNHKDSHKKILLVDDVHDTGLSMAAIIEHIKSFNPTADIRVATCYFKSEFSKVEFKPDYYACENNDWLVFPHELMGLSESEINQKKVSPPRLKSLISRHLRALSS